MSPRPAFVPRFGVANGWDRSFESYPERDLPAYVGPATFRKLPLVDERSELERLRPDVAIVGAPVDEAVSHRPGARFGPRAIRTAYYGSGHPYSLVHRVRPFESLVAVDAGDANVTPGRLERSHALVYRKIRDVAGSGAVPIVLGGDHSISWPAVTAVADVRWPQRIGLVHFDAHADTAAEEWGSPAGHGTPMRRLVESGAVAGRRFVQLGLRGYWPPPEVFEWMARRGMRWHLMAEIEARGIEPVVDDAIAEVLGEADAVYLSIDVDVLDPAAAPGTGTPEPGGLTSRELLAAVRRVAARVPLAGMDVVEVSPPFDVAEITSAVAHRAVMEAVSVLALRKARGEAIRFEAMAAAGDGLPAGPRLDLGLDLDLDPRGDRHGTAVASRPLVPVFEAFEAPEGRAPGEAPEGGAPGEAPDGETSDEAADGGSAAEVERTAPLGR